MMYETSDLKIDRIYDKTYFWIPVPVPKKL